MFAMEQTKMISAWWLLAFSRLNRIINRGLAVLVVLVLLTFLAVPANADSVLKQMRVGEQPDKTRIVFDFNDVPAYKIQTLASPNRLVVDFSNTNNKVSFKKRYITDPRLYSINVKNTARKTRVILNLHKSLKFSYFSLGKSNAGFERLVIDLKDEDLQVKSNQLAKAAPKVNPKTPSKTHTKPKSKTQSKVIAKRATKPKPQSVYDLIRKTVPNRQQIVVAIDAGHGGKDPGAIGKNGLYEKDATLQIAKRMRVLINKQPNMRAVMIRDKDVFVPLKKRVQIAKRHKADIFVSIHADAFRDSRVKGGSVYVLSERGASSTMAKLIAKRENQSLQAVDLSGFDNDVVYALSDMSREANIRVSRKLAKNVLFSMNQNVEMHKQYVQSANFAVLKTIDMPALLIETAFLSNPEEEKKLRNPRFQSKVAHSIVSGLNEFVLAYSDQPRWGEKLYVRYKVKHGDTLSEIAEEYGVSLRELKRLNEIRNANQLYKGKVVKIPVSEQRLAQI